MPDKSLTPYRVRWTYTPRGGRPMSYSTKVPAENVEDARARFSAVCARDAMPVDCIAITGVERAD